MTTLHQTALSIGINPDKLPASPIIGKWYYLPVEGKKPSNTSGRVKLLAHGVAFMQNFVTGEKGNWFDDDLPIDRATIEERKRLIRLAQQQATREQEKQHKEAAIRARATWFDYAIAPDMFHPYLQKKRLKPYGLRQYQSALIVPVYSVDNGKIQSLQFIQPNGKKPFLTGGKTKGGYFATRPYKQGERIIIAEGWATSQSLAQQWQVIGWHVCAFSAGNLATVAKAMRRQHPKAQMVIAGDCDESGTGQREAVKAAQLVNGSVSIPEFTADERAKYGKVSDWQDRWMIDQRNKKEVSRYAD